MPNAPLQRFDQANDLTATLDVPAYADRMVMYGEDETGRVPLGSFALPESDEDACRTTLMMVVPESGFTVTFDLVPIFEDDDVASWTATVRCQAEETVHKDADWYAALLDRLANETDLGIALDPASTQAALSRRLQPRLEELSRYAQANLARDGRGAYFQAELGDLFQRLDFSEQAQTCWTAALAWAQRIGREDFAQAMQARLATMAPASAASLNPALPVRVMSQLQDRLIRWTTELWADPWLGQMATASAATHLTKDLQPDEPETSDFIRITCEWRPADASRPAALSVAWESNTSLPGTFWLQLTAPDDTSALLSEQPLGDRLTGERLWTEAELGFDPTATPWAVRILLVDAPSSST